MAITDLLILPPDVQIVPVAQVDPSLRGRMEIRADEYAVTRPLGRVPSKILTAHAVRLLERFRVATRIVDAVTAHAADVGADPRSLLDDTYPVLRDCFNARFLVEADSAEASRILPALQAGDRVDGYTVVRDVQVLEDTEVYLVRDGAHAPAALKIARPGARGRVERRLRREAHVLRYLDGVVAPKILRQGDHANCPYLVMAWCPGVPAGIAFAEARASTTAERRDLRALAGNVLGAYAALHARGVVHGDVHANNLLVDRDGRVTLVDFGLSVCAGVAPPDGRSGVAFFFEPEYARATLAGVASPPATAASDQYAVAALLYLLLTGDHYTEFSIERERMLRQIVDAPPLPFSRRGVAPWPAMEAVLARAMEKHPADRFPSVTAFVDAVRRAPAEPGADRAGAPNVAEWRSFVDRLRRDLDECDARVAELPSPTCSIMFGAGGVAYLLYRLAVTRGDPEALAEADRWLTAAEREAPTARAFRNDDGTITPTRVGRCSPFHSRTGLHCVRALLAQAAGDLPTVDAAVAAATEVGLLQPAGLDATLGVASVLLGYVLMYEALPTAAEDARRRLHTAGDETLARLWRAVESFPRIATCHDFPGLGMAHGWAGVLYVTLRWCAARGTPVPDQLSRRLAELADLGQPAGRGMRWPRTIHDDLSVPGWCNGSAGFVHLWTRAHRSEGEDRYADLANLAAWHTWEDPDPTPNLCCGLAGRAYGLLAFANHTGQTQWIDRAVTLAEWSAAVFDHHVTALPKPLSLYKGRSGTALILAELEQPHRAAMPFFGHEGWPARP